MCMSVLFGYLCAFIIHLNSFPASTLTQFSLCLRPTLMTAYPSATSAEINAITNAKWKTLKEARRKQAGNLCM